MTITTSFINTLGSVPTFTLTPDRDSIRDLSATGLSSGGFVLSYNSAPAGGGFLTSTVSVHDASGVELRKLVDATGLDVSTTELNDGNVVVAIDTGDDVEFEIRDPATGATIRALAPISNTGGVENDPQVLALQDGGFAIIYSEFFSNGSEADIELRTYNADGSTRNSTKINGQVDFDDVNPSAAVLANGNIAVVWERTGSSATGQELWRAIYDPALNVVAGETEITSGGINRDPFVVATESGFSVYFEDDSRAGSDLEVSVGHFTSGGSGTVASAVVSENLNFDDASDPTALWIGGSHMLAAYETFFPSPSGGDTDTLFRIVDASAADGVGPVSSSGPFLGAESDQEIDPVLAYLGGGQYLIAHSSLDTDVIEGKVFSLTRVLAGDSDNDTAIGSPFDELINGNGGNDVLFGMGGNDRINGGSGNDQIGGGEGDDLVRGDAGNDLIQANAGDDTVFGGAGNDTVSGGDGDDTVDGGVGNDIVVGGQNGFSDGDDILYGRGGDDFIEGFDGRDELYGGPGADRLFSAESAGDADTDVNLLFGGSGNDTLTGSEGADLLDGGAGADTMTGDLGNDFYVVDNIGDVVTETQSFSAGGGIDTVRSFISYTQPDNVELVRLGNLTDTDNLDATGNDAPGTLVGNAGNNELIGRGGNDQINGNGGADRLTGNTGRDTLVGGAGADTFLYSSISESRAGAANRDVINGFDRGADRIDLSAMDANLGGPGEGAFTFLGTGRFTGTAGELRLQGLGGANAVLVEGDVRGDGVADFQIFVNLTTVLSASDFIL